MCRRATRLSGTLGAERFVEIDQHVANVATPAARVFLETALQQRRDARRMCELTAESLLAPASGAGLDAVTTRYGVAAWHRANGRPDQALAGNHRLARAHAARQ